MEEPARQLGPYDEEQEGEPRPKPELASEGERGGPTHIGQLSDASSESNQSPDYGRDAVSDAEQRHKNQQQDREPAEHSDDPSSRPALKALEGGGEDTSGPTDKLAEAPKSPYDEPTGTAPSTPGPSNLRDLENGSVGRPEQKNEPKSDERGKEDSSPGSDRSSQRHGKASSDKDGASFYRQTHDRTNPANKINDPKRRRRYIIFGALAAVIIAVVVALFSFLNFFKLDGLMSNIEQKAFLRNNAVLDKRSRVLMRDYIEARLLDMGDHPNFSNPNFKKDDNLLFRATRVQTGRLFKDWYRTLRTSKFEQTVFEKEGIKFTSVVTADGKFRPGVIDISGEKPIPFNVSEISATDYANLSRGNIATIRQFGDIVDTHVFNTNKEARAAIKEAVYRNTRWWQVFYRRALRKAIQNMTGVKSWRFFETTRDKIANKKIEIRNRIIRDILPNDSIIQKIAQCFYGLKTCRDTSDVADNELRLNEGTVGEGPSTDKNTKKEKANETKLKAPLDPAGISDALKKILNATDIYLRLLNIPYTLDMLAAVNHALSHLFKLVVIARGAQAAGLFQVFETARDQIKTGQVNGTEVNLFMQNIDTAAASDAYVKGIEGKGGPAVPQTGGACSQQAQALEEKDQAAYQKKYGVYAPLCADQQIGRADNAKAIQDAYKSTIGGVVGPIVKAWSNLKNSFLGSVINVLEKLGNLVGKLATDAVLKVLDVLGLSGDIKHALTWVFAKTANFLGLTIIKGYESAGTIFNWLFQGGAYTAESAQRFNGAALTTPASKATTQGAITGYEEDLKNSTSLYDRVASLDNPNSLAFRGAFALSNLKSNPSGSFMATLQSMWTDAAKNLGSLFGGHIYAATPSGYTAAQFANIQTYDFPQKCYDLNSTTSLPREGTNALDIFNKYDIHVTSDDMAKLNSWDTEANSNNFYDAIYTIIRRKYPDTASDYAEQIYNCNLLDATTMDSLGYTSGYSNVNDNVAQ